MTKRKDNPNQLPATLDETTQDAVETDSESRKRKMKLSRRRFIAASSGAAASILATGNSLAEPQRQSRAPRGGQIAAPKVVRDSGESASFREPESIHARYINGESILEAVLNVELADWRYTCGTTESYVQVPIYNHKVPGPTLIVEPGSTLKLTLNNNMPMQSPFSSDTCMGCGEHHSSGTTPPPANCFMHTNLHTHGLLVSPCSIDRTGKTHCGPTCSDQLRVSSDDVLIDIPPQGKNEYCIELPKFHDSGTYWYHSHLHGASGYQVAGGLAGALIIEDRPGEELVQQDQDKIFVVQEVVTSQGTNYPGVYLSAQAGSSQFFVNGQCTPTLQMWAGQTQRWRLINATGTPRGLMKVWLYKCSDNPAANCDTTNLPNLNRNVPNPVMYLMAVDGIAFYGFPPMPVRAHLMAAGNRADFLVNLPPGKYMLIKDAFPLDANNIWATGADNLNATVKSRQALAIIEVRESVYKKYTETIPQVIPGRRPFYLEPIADTQYLKKGRQVTFTALQSGASGRPAGVLQGSFKIDGNFYPENNDIVVDLDTAEEITISNLGGTDSATFAQLPHPFHIHVNPFQMVGRTLDFEVVPEDRQYLPPAFRQPMDPTDPCNWMWMDTSSMPAPGKNLPGMGLGQFKLRTRFLVYPGEFVIHCHMLVHEDVGMMVNVKVKGDGKGPCVKVDDPPGDSRRCVERTTKPCR